MKVVKAPEVVQSKSFVALYGLMTLEVVEALESLVAWGFLEFLEGLIGSGGSEFFCSPEGLGVFGGFRRVWVLQSSQRI